MESRVKAMRGLYGQSSNGEAGRGDAGPGKVRQQWIVQARQRVAGIGRAVKAVPVRARPGTLRR